MQFGKKGATGERDAATAKLRGAARDVLGWQAVEYSGLALYLLVVPRAMGPERYGAFAALLSLVGLLMMASGLGALATFGRFAPEYMERGETGRLRQLFTQVVAARALVGAALALLLFALLSSALPGYSARTAAAAAGALLLAAASASCFQVFYGLNRLGRWMVNSALNRPLLVGLLFALGGVLSLERASLALLVTELSFFVLGIAWAGRYFALDRSLLDMQSLSLHLRFGLLFFATSLCQIALWKGGEVLVLALSGQGAEVAYFSVAVSVTAALAGLVGQLGLALVPTATAAHLRGERERVEDWMGTSLKYLTAAALLFVLAVHGFGEWGLTLLLGEQYRPMAASLETLSFALLPVGLMRTAISLSVVVGEPRKGVVMTGAGLVVFLVAAVALIPGQAAHGAAIAVVLGLGAAALVACRLFPFRRILATARLGRLLASGVVAFAALGLLATAPLVARAGVLAGFAVLLFATRALTPGEVAGRARSLLGRTSG